MYIRAHLSREVLRPKGTYQISHPQPPPLRHRQHRSPFWERRRRLAGPPNQGRRLLPRKTVMSPALEMICHLVYREKESKACRPGWPHLDLKVSTARPRCLKRACCCCGSRGRSRGEGEGYSFVACLSHLTVCLASLSSRSTRGSGDKVRVEYAACALACSTRIMR